MEYNEFYSYTTRQELRDGYILRSLQYAPQGLCLDAIVSHPLALLAPLALICCSQSYVACFNFTPKGSIPLTDELKRSVIG
jgi:hypothetical protein